MDKVNWQYPVKPAHNKGKFKADQEGLADNEKRCSDCQEVKVLDDFFRNSKAPKGVMPWCKECWNRRYYKKKVAPDPTIRSEKFQVVFDPTGTYEKGVFFEKWDFYESMKGNVWPVGMIVKRTYDNRLLVVATSLVYVETAYKNQIEEAA